MVCVVAMSMSCLYSREEIMSMKCIARIFIFLKVQNIYVKCYTSEYETRYFFLKKKANTFAID